MESRGAQEECRRAVCACIVCMWVKDMLRTFCSSSAALATLSVSLCMDRRMRLTLLVVTRRCEQAVGVDARSACPAYARAARRT